MNKKIPMRSCIVTKEKYPKKELLRIVKTPDNQIIIDTTGKTNGHGAYLKKDKEVVLKAQKNKILDHFLEQEISDEIYNKILKLVGENDE